MDDIERKLAALGRLDVEATSPPVQAIARRARVRRGTTATISLAAAVVVAIGGYAGVRALAPVEPQPVAPAILTDAVLTTQEEGTARTELDIVLHTEGGAFSNDQEIHGTGEIDFDEDVSRLVSESTFPATSLETIQDGTTVYQRGSSFEDPKAWTKYEISQSASGVFAGDKGPDDYLLTLGAIGRVERVGEEELDGDTVVHYRATVDPELFLQELMADALLEQRLDEIDVDLDPIEVWVDEEGRVRRMDMAMTMSYLGEEALSVDFEGSFRYFDFGVAVDIEIPNPQDVVERTPPPFASPSHEPDAGSGAGLVAGDEGVAQPYLLVDPRAERVCFMHAPGFAASATVEHEPTGEHVVTFEEDEIIADPETEGAAMGCASNVSKRDLSNLLESPNDYLLRIGGGSPPRVVYLTEVITDP